MKQASVLRFDVDFSWKRHVSPNDLIALPSGAGVNQNPIRSRYELTTWSIILLEQLVVPTSSPILGFL